MLIGAHVDNADPATAAKEKGADVVQLFLGDPQSWKAPTLLEVDTGGVPFSYTARTS
jgi:endonuclease IV